MKPRQQQASNNNKKTTSSGFFRIDEWMGKTGSEMVKIIIIIKKLCEDDN